MGALIMTSIEQTYGKEFSTPVGIKPRPSFMGEPFDQGANFKCVFFNIYYYREISAIRFMLREKSLVSKFCEYCPKISQSLEFFKNYTGNLDGRLW